MIGYLPHQSVGFAHAQAESESPLLWDHLTVCAAPCLGIGGNRIADLSPHRFDFASTGTASALSFTASPWGPAARFAGNVAWQQAGSASYTLPCKFCTNSFDYTDAFTIQALFRFAHSGSAKESTLFWSDNPTLGSLIYGYRLYVDNNTDKLKLMIANGDNMVTTTPTYYTSATTLTSGQWYNVVVLYGWSIFNTGQGCIMCINSPAWEYPTITNSTPAGVETYCAHLGTQNSRIGASLGSVAPDFEVALLNVWNTVSMFDDVNLTGGSAIDYLLTDPLRMFRLAE